MWFFKFFKWLFLKFLAFLKLLFGFGGGAGNNCPVFEGGRTAVDSVCSESDGRGTRPRVRCQGASHISL